LNQLDSLIEFRASLDFDGAKGNPLLTESLMCANASVDAAQINLLKSLEPLQPIMAIIGMVAGVAQEEVAIPDFAGMAADTDVGATIASVRGVIDSLQAVVDAIPG
jgi:hypothetical protein